MLCAPLRAEGVSVFYGYSQSVTFDYDYKWEEVFFARLRAGDTVAQAVAQMKTEIGQWDYCSEYLTIESARRNYCAFPIVSSALDAYPGKQGRCPAGGLFRLAALRQGEIHRYGRLGQHGPRHSRAAERPDV